MGRSSTAVTAGLHQEAAGFPSPSVINDAPVFEGRKSAPTMIIACGALAREIVHFRDLHTVPAFDVACLPASIHNAPQLIPERVRAKIREYRATYARILVAFADCGTGGLLDKVLREEGVARIDGPHCYAFYSGQTAFRDLAKEAIGTLYLTDYMVRHFDKLIMEGLGLDRFPHLRDEYFGNYTRCLYIAQTEDEALQSTARQAARRLNLHYAYRFVGYGELQGFLAAAASQPYAC